MMGKSVDIFLDEWDMEGNWRCRLVFCYDVQGGDDEHKADAFGSVGSG